MKLSNIVVAAAVVVLIGAVGCKSAKQEAPQPAGQSLPAGHPAVGNQAGGNQAGGISGKVVETMNSGGYTYVCLENSGQKTWVALPETKVAVGQQVTCMPGAVMQNFTSKTLKRTFDSIVFSGGMM
ncbi:MAG TPA: hypothetical protein VIX18_11900 [Nitrospirota bacterium]